MASRSPCSRTATRAWARQRDAFAAAEGALQILPDNCEMLRLATDLAFQLNDHARARVFAARALAARRSPPLPRAVVSLVRAAAHIPVLRRWFVPERVAGLDSDASEREQWRVWAERYLQCGPATAMELNRLRIDSYDPASGRLEITLSEGRYEYFDVPASAYQAVVMSSNPVETFNNVIWNKFEHRGPWASLEEFFCALVDAEIGFEAPVSIDSRQLWDEDGPLHVAAIWGDLRGVELLLNAGADPDKRGDLDTTPLYCAVSFGHVRCAAALVKAGASPDAYNELNSTPRLRARDSEDRRMRALFE
jgi:hypothetical protein